MSANDPTQPFAPAGGGGDGDADGVGGSGGGGGGDFGVGGGGTFSPGAEFKGPGPDGREVDVDRQPSGGDTGPDPTDVDTGPGAGGTGIPGAPREQQPDTPTRPSSPVDRPSGTGGGRGGNFSSVDAGGITEEASAQAQGAELLAPEEVSKRDFFAGQSRRTGQQARDLEQRVLENNPDLSAQDVRIKRTARGFDVELTASGRKKRSADVSAPSGGFGSVRGGTPDAVLPPLLGGGSGVSQPQGGLPTTRGGRVQPERTIPSEIRGAPQQPAAKIETELEQATGADLEPGADFTIEATDEGFEAEFTPAGRIKVAGVPETGETFLDREIINPFLGGVESDIEASAAVDVSGFDFEFVSGRGDLVQQIKADLRRDAQIHREGIGILPSGEQAEAAVEPIVTAKEEAGLPFVPSPDPDITAGFAARAGTTINPAGITLGLAEAGESVGEFGFNKVVGSLNPPELTVEGEELDLGAGVLDIPTIEFGEFESTPTPGPGPPRMERIGGLAFGGGQIDAAPIFKEFDEVTGEAEQRAEAQEAAFGAALVGLGEATVESFQKEPTRTGGAALFEAGLLFGGAAASPFRVRSISVPTTVGGKTTIRGLRLETPPVLRATGRRTAGRTLVSQRGVGLTRGVPEIAPDAVDLERLPGQAFTFERIAPFETEVFGETARLGGREAARKVEAQEALAESVRKFDSELELSTTEEIVGEVERVPLEKVGAVAEALEELDAEIFGSAALRAQFPDVARKPGDIDIVVSDEAAARARLSKALEGAGADVGDVFDIKTTAEAPRPGEPVKLGQFAGPRLETEGGVKVVSAVEELQKKTGASGFLRGAGSPAPQFVGQTDVFDIGPEPVRPGLEPRFKDVGDASAISRAIIGGEAAATSPLNVLRRRRISEASEAVREFEEAFGAELEAVPPTRQPPTLQPLPEMKGDLSGVEAIDFEAMAKRLGGDPDRAQFTIPGIVGPGAGRAAGEQAGGGILSIGGDLAPSPGSAARVAAEPEFGIPLRPGSGGRVGDEDTASATVFDDVEFPTQSSLTESIVGSPGRGGGLLGGGLFAGGLFGEDSGGSRFDELDVGGGFGSTTAPTEEPASDLFSPITVPSGGGVGGGDGFGGGLTLPGSGFDSPTEPGGGGITVPSPTPTFNVPGLEFTLSARRAPRPEGDSDRSRSRQRRGFAEIQFAPSVGGVDELVLGEDIIVGDDPGEAGFLGPGAFPTFVEPELGAEVSQRVTGVTAGGEPFGFFRQRPEGTERVPFDEGLMGELDSLGDIGRGDSLGEVGENRDSFGFGF